MFISLSSAYTTLHVAHKSVTPLNNNTIVNGFRLGKTFIATSMILQVTILPESH